MTLDSNCSADEMTAAGHTLSQGKELSLLKATLALNNITSKRRKNVFLSTHTHKRHLSELLRAIEWKAKGKERAKEKYGESLLRVVHFDCCVLYSALVREFGMLERIVLVSGNA